MVDLDATFAVRALRETGVVLATRHPQWRVRLVIGGGTAGLLARLLSPARTTADCDVIWHDAAVPWEEVESAASEVAAALMLPPRWLNRDSVHFAWTLPLGWRERCEEVGTVGVLEVSRLSRLDLIATKTVGAPQRPQDLEDLLAIRPTRAELVRVVEHLDRLEAEHLDGASFDDQRAIVRVLETTL